MKSFIYLLAVLICAVSVSSAQSVKSNTLSDALHCIKNDDRDWLSTPVSKGQVIHATAVEDDTSYPHEKHLIVVVHEGARAGQFFDLEEETTGGKRLFTIENNGSFSIVNGKIEFRDPPLGGVWTQEHLAVSIQMAVNQPRQTFTVASLLKAGSGVVCSSYAPSNK